MVRDLCTCCVCVFASVAMWLKLICLIMDCPVCLGPITDTDFVRRWPCAHAAHASCVAGREHIPCATCRAPSAAPRLFDDEDDDDDNEPERNVFFPPRVIPLCCNRVLFADNQFFTSDDRRMVWAPLQTADGPKPLFQCVSCGADFKHVDLPDCLATDPRRWCEVHGLRSSVWDLKMGIMFWSCKRSDPRGVETDHMIDPRGFDTCPNTARDTRLIPEDFVVLSQDPNVADGQNSNDDDAMEEERATESNDDVEVSDGASQTSEEQAIADGQQATLSGPDPGDPPRSCEEQLDELLHVFHG